MATTLIPPGINNLENTIGHKILDPIVLILIHNYQYSTVRRRIESGACRSLILYLRESD